MRRSITAALRISLVLFLLPSFSFSQVPRVISYQGVLTDSLGTPKPDGSYSFVFRFYKAPSGGTAIWSESKSLLTRHGLFSTMLGDTDPFPDSVSFNSTYWLSVQVGSDELAPRIQLGAVGYAIRAINADTANFVLNAASVQRPISPGISNSELADNAVTSAKISDGTITTADVASTFIAPKADTAAVALAALSAPPGGSAGGALSGSYPNPAIAANAVGSNAIADSSIMSIDVAPSFKAPKADTASVALVALTSAPGGSAGGDLSGSYPNPTIATNAITSAKIADGAIVTADAASSFKAPKADTADFALAAVPASNSVSTATLQDNAVTSGKIQDGSVTTADLASTLIAPKADTANFAKAAVPASNSVSTSALQDNAVTSGKIQDGSVTTADLASTVVAPKADTANVALTALSSSPTGVAGGDLAGSYPNPSIADSAITSAKILSNSVTDAKITGMSASKLTGPLPVLDGSSLTGVNASTLQGSAASAFAASTHTHAMGDLTGTLPLENGGTGSSTRNFVYLTDDDTIRGSKVFSPTTSVTGLVVRRTPFASEVAPPAFSVTTQDGSSSLFNVAWNGVLSGYASGLTGLNAGELSFGTIPDGRLSGSYSSALTLSNVSNSFTGDGSGLSNLTASNLASGSLPDQRLAGTYSQSLTLTNANNSFTGKSLTIDSTLISADTVNNRVGIGTSSPTSTMDVAGSLGLKYRSVSGGTTVTAGEESVFLVSTTGGAVTINLPSASSCPGRIYFFKLIAFNTNSLTIDASGSELIDGASTFVLNALNKSVTMISDGSSWYTLAII